MMRASSTSCSAADAVPYPDSAANALSDGASITAAPERKSACPSIQAPSDVAAITSFDDMPLHDAILRGVYSHGFERPSPVQQLAIVPVIRGGDVIAQAQSGTGKTGAFTIGLLQRCDFGRCGTASQQRVQALVLEPTRELAHQSCGVAASLGAFAARQMIDVSDTDDEFDDDATSPRGSAFCALFVGGTNVGADVRRLKAGVTVAVGTPGRVLQLVERGALRMAAVKVIVLDEADEMLSQGFAEQVQRVFRFAPRDVQVCLFSATLPDEVVRLADQFMRSPTRILVARESLTLSGIRQYHVAVAGDDEKLTVLGDLYDTVSVAQSVIFCASRRKVEYVAQWMRRAGHGVAMLHAEMERPEREATMGAFRGGSSRVLVCTDLLSRGIDIHHVNVVINFDLPANLEAYLHRIGRSGRYGRRGVAINLVSARDADLLRAVEAHYSIAVPPLPMDFAAFLGDDT